jgi:hypothetical protein
VVAAFVMAGCSTDAEPDAAGGSAGSGAAGTTAGADPDVSASAVPGASAATTAGDPSAGGPADADAAAPPAATGEVVPGTQLAERVLAAVSAAGSARVRLSSTLADSSLSSEGVVRFGDPYQLDVTTTVGSEGGDITSRIVVLSPTEAYVELPEAGGWIPIAAAGDLGLTGALGTEYLAPDSTWQAWGASGDFEVVGGESVDGVPATRYRLTDVAAAAAGSPGLESVDVWLDGDDLPVRTELAVSDPAPATVTIDYRAWGEPVAVQAPPADEILDL